MTDAPIDYAAQARELAGLHNRLCVSTPTMNHGPGTCICSVAPRAAAIEAALVTVREDEREKWREYCQFVADASAVAWLISAIHGNVVSDADMQKAKRLRDVLGVDSQLMDITEEVDDGE